MEAGHLAKNVGLFWNPPPSVNHRCVFGTVMSYDGPPLAENYDQGTLYFRAIDNPTTNTVNEVGGKTENL